MSSSSISVVFPMTGLDEVEAQSVQQYANALATLEVPIEILMSGPILPRTPIDALPAQVRFVSGGDRWGAAIRAGLSAARGDLLAWAHPIRTEPASLVRALGYALARPDVVVRSNRRTRDNLGRRIGSLAYNVECRLLYGLTTWDVNGTPKVFPRSMTRLLELQRDDSLIEVEFCLVCQRAGYDVIEVPAREREITPLFATEPPALRLYVDTLRAYRTLRAETR